MSTCPTLQDAGLRRALPTFGSRRLIREFELPISHGALERIWRAHGLLQTRRRKYQRKQDLAAIQATWRLFQQISAGTKDLDDIPHYWLQAQRLRLPPIEYTACEVRSGLTFLAFAQQRSAAASAVFATRIQTHLSRYGVSLRDLIWQTDSHTQGQSEPVADHRAARFSLAARTLLASTRVLGLLPQRLRGDTMFLGFP